MDQMGCGKKKVPLRAETQEPASHSTRRQATRKRPVLHRATWSQAISVRHKFEPVLSVFIIKTDQFLSIL
jgi:hypothetical protein